MESENATFNGCSLSYLSHRLSCLTNKMNKQINDTIMNQDISAMYSWSKFISINKSSKIVIV